jgi:tetrahydromethanopterin S-methyltransferase subunit B
VIPGTEGMAAYKNYAMHFKGFLLGTGISVVLGLLLATFVMSL